jgi:hypothetical protein
MPIDTIANACYLGSDMPIRPWNPHTRGTTKYTKCQNINRNVRLHLRNDRKIVQNDLLLAQAVHDAHFIFYCTLSSLDTWHHIRQLLSHDRTLIRQWAAIYRQGKNTVLKLGLMPHTQQATQMMTRLLVQHLKRTLTFAETDPCSTTSLTDICVAYSSQLATNRTFLHTFAQSHFGPSHYSAL